MAICGIAQRSSYPGRGQPELVVFSHYVMDYRNELFLVVFFFRVVADADFR
jgi:hypothetical protein